MRLAMSRSRGGGSRTRKKTRGQSPAALPFAHAPASTSELSTLMAEPTGLEPATSWLTTRCATIAPRNRIDSEMVSPAGHDPAPTRVRTERSAHLSYGDLMIDAKCLSPLASSIYYLTSFYATQFLMTGLMELPTGIEPAFFRLRI